MEKWAICVKQEEVSILMHILDRCGYEGTGFCYILSNPRCILVDSEAKTYKIGCRNTNQIADTAETFYSMLLLIAKNEI